MRLPEWLLALVSTCIWGYLALMTEMPVLDSFIWAYLSYTLLRFINNLGYTICYFEFLIFYSALDTLLMPLIGYRNFGIDNKLSKLWGAYMRVPEDTYFSYLIPANILLFMGLVLFTWKREKEDKSFFFRLFNNRKKEYGMIGIVMTVSGFLFTYISPLFQGSLSHVLYLLTMLKYVGPLYIYFSDFSYRKPALWGSILLFFLQAVIVGMFGDFVMYLLLILIIVLLKNKPRFYVKLPVFLVGLFLILVLQNVKVYYRLVTWNNQTVEGYSLEKSSPVEIFVGLFLNKAQSWKSINDEYTMFIAYRRFNQGWLISRAMRYVPDVEPYANGSTLVRSVAAVIVPRFIWKNKPEAGGHENLARFLGIKRKLRYSMNIGPYGEAYGNFGPNGGLVFIFFYGLLLALLMNKVRDLIWKYPSLLLWLPLLFYYTLSVETDIMTTLNSFFKAGVFVFLLYWGSARILKIKL